MIDLLQRAIERRTELLESLHAEGTNCYRLFHGTNEGAPGLTIDRYGPQLLIQAFHSPIDEVLAEQIHAVVNHMLGETLECVYNDRSERNSRHSCSTANFNGY